MSGLFDFDKEFEKTIIGTDEAGRGPGAGGVFAAAVCFKQKDFEQAQAKLALLNDSKKLSKKIREELFEIIKGCSYYSIQCIEVDEIERINILNASLNAMKLACEDVIEQYCLANMSGEQVNNPFTSYLSQFTTLVDGNRKIKGYSYFQQIIIKGDSKSASIAAASVLAKVARDRYMQGLHEIYPQYAWAQNAGYLTKKHVQAIHKYGITPYHRKKFLRKIAKGVLSEI